MSAFISFLIRIVEMLTGAMRLALTIAPLSRLIRLATVVQWQRAMSWQVPRVPFYNHPPEAWAAP